MNNTSKCLVAGALAVGMPFTAQAESPHSFSANVGLFSDYLFRGISQTERGPAVQGGFDYGYDAGEFEPYLGVWASSIDFGADDGESVEMNIYGGVAGELADTGIGWDVGALHYFYPKVDSSLDFDYTEVYGALDYTFDQFMYEPSFGVFYAYSPNFFGDTGSAHYVSPSLDFALPHGFGVSLAYGYQDIKDLGDYSHWSIGVSKELGMFTADLTFSQTFGDSSFDGGAGLGRLGQDTVVFSFTADF